MYIQRQPWAAAGAGRNAAAATITPHPGAQLKYRRPATSPSSPRGSSSSTPAKIPSPRAVQMPSQATRPVPHRSPVSQRSPTNHLRSFDVQTVSEQGVKRGCGAYGSRTARAIRSHTASCSWISRIFALGVLAHGV